MPEQSSHVISFRVQVGHASVEVDSENQEQAIAAARRKLADQLPRLWDVIHQMPVERFQVTAME